jgi:hypothetical protein
VLAGGAGQIGARTQAVGAPERLELVLKDGGEVTHG